MRHHCNFWVAMLSNIVKQGDMHRHYYFPTLVVVLTFREIEHSSNGCIFALMLVIRDSSMLVDPSLVWMLVI